MKLQFSKYCFIILSSLFLHLECKSQTYVGNVLISNKIEYAKISLEGNKWVLTMPFYNDEKGIFENDILYQKNKLSIFEESWNISKKNKKTSELEFKISNNKGDQTVKFFLLKKTLSKKQSSRYSGTFMDNNGNVSIFENLFGGIRVISPFSGNTMFLKQLQRNIFWTTSGEKWVFNKSIDIVTHISLQGKKTILKKKKLFNIKEVWIPHNKDTLYGKLFMPINTKKQNPGCLILQGGGSVGLKNYEYEAHFLAANGIAILLCNKAGEGKSKGESNFNYQTFVEKTAEYNALFEFLKTQPNIDKSKVGVHGISEGGRLALRLGAYNNDVAFILAGAAPIMSFIDGQLYAMNQLHRDLNINETTNLKVQNIWKTYYDNIINGKIDKSNIDLANSLRNIHPRFFLPPNSTEVPGSPRKEDLFGSKSFKYLSKIKSPILLQYGENDHRVNPYKSLDNFRRNINKTTSWKKIIYKRANHSFMSPEFQIATNYLKDKINWLKSIQILK